MRWSAQIKRDAITVRKLKKGEKDYTKFLDRDGLRGARIGVARQYLGKDEKAKSNYRSAPKNLKDGGATLIDVTFPTVEDFGKWAKTLQILLYEFKADLNKYLAARNGSQYKTLAELIKYNEDNKDREMPLFGQELFQRIGKQAAI